MNILRLFDIFVSFFASVDYQYLLNYIKFWHFVIFTVIIGGSITLYKWTNTITEAKRKKLQDYDDNFKTIKEISKKIEFLYENFPNNLSMLKVLEIADPSCSIFEKEGKEYAKVKKDLINEINLLDSQYPGFAQNDKVKELQRLFDFVHVFFSYICLIKDIIPKVDSYPKDKRIKYFNQFVAYLRKNYKNKYSQLECTNINSSELCKILSSLALEAQNNPQSINVAYKAVPILLNLTSESAKIDEMVKTKNMLFDKKGFNKGVAKFILSLK